MIRENQKTLNKLQIIMDMAIIVISFLITYYLRFYVLDKYSIVRISWVFGENGNDFIDTMLRLSSDKYGVYHVTNEGYCSWYDFAKKICELKNIYIKINSILTSQYPIKASRLLNSKLSKGKLVENVFYSLRSCEEALIDYLDIR